MSHAGAPCRGCRPDLRGRPEPAVTGMVTVTALGDTTSATSVAAGQRVSPLFFQPVPDAVAGYLAARWDVTGPARVIGMSAGPGIAPLLIDEADADEALAVPIGMAVAGDDPDRGTALLESRPDRDVAVTA